MMQVRKFNLPTPIVGDLMNTRNTGSFDGGFLALRVKGKRQDEGSKIIGEDGFSQSIRSLIHVGIL